MVVVLLVLAIGLGVLVVPRLGRGLTPDGPPGPALVLTQSPVVEAIDLPEEPVVGTPWRVAMPPDSMDQDLFVTPCGILVSVDSDSGANASLKAFDIAAGRLMWTLPLAGVTGLVDPYPAGQTLSYSPKCKMLLGADGSADRGAANVRVFLLVDLADGSARTVYSGPTASCVAAGDEWAGCLDSQGDGTTEFVFSVSLVTGEQVWRESAPGAGHRPLDQALVLAGRIWTPGGYRDPATGQVMFGADSSSWAEGQDAKDREVAYFQVWRPGGYLTDAVVRVEGPGDSSPGRCTVQLWDTLRDSPVWPNAATQACGAGDGYGWLRAGQVLLGQRVTGVGAYMSAFSMGDGHLLWSLPGYEAETPWDHGWVTYVPGASDFLVARSPDFEHTDNPIAVRISDGTVMTMPEPGQFAASETMVYFPACPSDPSPCRVTAYRPNPDKPTATPEKLWSVEVANNSTSALIWTFATGGRMYAVVVGHTTRVFPLT